MSGDGGDPGGDPGAPGSIGSMGTSEGDPGQSPGEGVSGDFGSVSLSAIDPTANTSTSDAVSYGGTMSADLDDRSGSSGTGSLAGQAAPLSQKSDDQDKADRDAFEEMEDSFEYAHPSKAGDLDANVSKSVSRAQAKAKARGEGYYSITEAGRVAAQETNPNLSKGDAWGESHDQQQARGDFVSKTLGGVTGTVVSMVADTLGRSGVSIEDPSFNEPEGVGPEPPPPPEPVVTPLPEIVSAEEPGPPLTKTPEADTGFTPAPEEPAPMVSPKPASAAPGTLLRRRRRTRTILTSPQGVLGGSAAPARRTRSLPRKTLLGG